MEKYYIFEIKEHTETELNNLKNLLANFEQTNNYAKADFIVSFGGDGTLLDCFEKFPHKKIYPIRDYSQCDFHKNHVIEPNYIHDEFDILSYDKFYQDRKNDSTFNVLSEIVIRNSNLSQAMRCNLYINDKIYAKNIIGDGLIFCTSLGSTGYFKNVTNTFFTKGNLGIGFINNTQNMTNFIIPIDSIITVELTRGDCQIALDHKVFPLDEGESFKIWKSKFSARLINYREHFMCNECRNLRHAANVNSIYKVI